MKEFTYDKDFLKECVDSHKKLWMWIANETRRKKRKINKIDYFLINHILDIPENTCYFCNFVHCVSLKNNSINLGDPCQFCCPGNWANSKNTCSHSNTLYTSFTFTSTYNWKKAADLAEQIANIPIRFEY